MPIRRFALILLAVVLAAGVTIATAALLGGNVDMSRAGPGLVLLTLITAVGLRVLGRYHRTPHDGNGSE